jgi:hypothetical protein
MPSALTGSPVTWIAVSSLAKQANEVVGDEGNGRVRVRISRLAPAAAPSTNCCSCEVNLTAYRYHQSKA